MMLTIKMILMSLNLFDTIFRTDTDLYFFLKSCSALNFLSNDVFQDLFLPEGSF